MLNRCQAKIENNFDEYIRRKKKRDFKYSINCAEKENVGKKKTIKKRNSSRNRNPGVTQT